MDPQSDQPRSDARDDLAPAISLAPGGALLATGLIVITSSLTWLTGLPRCITGSAGVFLLLLGTTLLVRAKLRRAKAEASLAARSAPPPERTFGRYITGLGYVLLLVGMCTGLTATGLIRAGHVELSGAAFEKSIAIPATVAVASPEAKPARERLGMLVLLSIEFSVLGAVFFVTNTMYERRRNAGGAGVAAEEEDGPEKFCEERFWGGLFFRLGEAVLFTFTFFLLFWKYADSAAYTWLPIVGLFSGMFVKTGETVVFGIGQRFLAAAAAFVPLPTSPKPAREQDREGGDAREPVAA